MGLSAYQKRLLDRNIKIIVRLEEGTSPFDVAKEYNVSVATVYNIQKAFKEQKIKGLIPNDKIPLHRPQRLPDVEATTLYIRDKTNLGAEKIYDILVSEHDKYGINLCDIPHSRTIHSILQQNGRIIKPKIKTKVRTPDFYRVKDIEHPGQTVEMDIKSDHYLKGIPVNLIAAIDISSKVVTGEPYPCQTSQNVSLILISHVCSYGIPYILKTDNGAASSGKIDDPSFGIFTRLALFLGIEQVFIPIHEPKWNTFIERFFGTWDKEFWNINYFRSYEELFRKHCEFIDYYLKRRPHQGLRKSKCNSDHTKIPLQFFDKYATPRYPEMSWKALTNLLSNHKIPITKGKVSFLRRVPKSSIVSFKGHKIKVPDSLIGQVVKGTVFVEPGESTYKMALYFHDMRIKDILYRTGR